ncbi:MAG: CoA pyrophosphatase [Pseudomonadota bacterium]
MDNTQNTTINTENAFSISDFEKRARQFLSADVPKIDHQSLPKVLGDHQLNPDLHPALIPQIKYVAAVLIPVISRPHGPCIIFTKRSEDLPHHPGQISFPGGIAQSQDHNLLTTALREANEEIGLHETSCRTIGYLDPYLTVTGFCITPVVGLIERDFVAKIDPKEVANVFDVPLAFLMSSANHQKHSLSWQGKVRYYHAMPYKNHYIWGATAGILHSLYERLYHL